MWVLPFSAAARGVTLLSGEAAWGEGRAGAAGGFGEPGEVGRWWVRCCWMGRSGSMGSAGAPGVPEPGPASGEMLSKGFCSWSG